MTAIQRNIFFIWHDLKQVWMIDEHISVLCFQKYKNASTNVKMTKQLKQGDSVLTWGWFAKLNTHKNHANSWGMEDDKRAYVGRWK